MKNKLRFLLAAFALAAVVLFASGKGTGAASSSGPTGITVSPAFQQVSINSNESEHPVSFAITNNKATPQTLNLASADFNTLNESGGLLFVGTNPTELQKKYGLAKWLSLPRSQVTIQPKQTAVIKADILNLSSMPAGGHYGALMISIGTGQSGVQNGIALHPIASSLLFVTKLGGDTHKLGLAGVSFKRTLFTLPSSVTLRFHNDGNTHLIPRGTVTITSPSGKLISKGIINDDSGIILPETYRQYYVPMQAIAHADALGKYQVNVDFRFDGFSQFRGYRQSIFYMPAIWVGIGIVILAALIFGVYKIIATKRSPKN